MVPRSWLEVATTVHAGPTWVKGINYGYQLYVASGANGPRWVGGIGNGGQHMMAMPDLDVTVAVLSGNYDGVDQGREARAVLGDVIRQ